MASEQLELSETDQLALGRVLHRYFTQASVPYANLLSDGECGVPDDLVLDGTVTVLRDDELTAISRLMESRHE